MIYPSEFIQPPLFEKEGILNIKAEQSLRRVVSFTEKTIP
jgi:hypothetical protein